MANTDNNWDNDDPIDLRTKIALKILILMFKILSPYKFEHRFEKDLKSINEDIGNVK